METRQIIATNIAALRTASGLTQIELANELNYSDKAVSKWERGESVPDVVALKQIADRFGVTLDYLVTVPHTAEDIEKAGGKSRKKALKNRAIITGIAIITVWIVCAVAFLVLHRIFPDAKVIDLSFVYAIVLSLVLWLVFNSIWFNKRKNYLIVSLLMWSCLLAAQLTLFVFGINVWPVYFLGIPGQIIIYFCSKFIY